VEIGKKLESFEVQKLSDIRIRSRQPDPGITDVGRFHEFYLLDETWALPWKYQQAPVRTFVAQKTNRGLESPGEGNLESAD